MTAIEQVPNTGEEPHPDDTSLVSLIKSGLEKAGVRPTETHPDEQTTVLDFGEKGVADLPGSKPPSSDGQ